MPARNLLSEKMNIDYLSGGVHGLGPRDRGAQAEPVQANRLGRPVRKFRQPSLVPPTCKRELKFARASRVPDRPSDHGMNIVFTLVGDA